MKRIFSFVLCMVMLFSLLPLQAQAAEIDHEGLIRKMATPKGLMTSDAAIDYSAFPIGAGRAVNDNSVSEVEPNDTFPNAQRIYSDDTITGTLSSSDLLDIYKFNVPTPSTVTIIAASYYSSFIMGVFRSEDDCVASDITGDYTDGLYIYALTGTNAKGTYYLTMLDSDMAANLYSFYILIEPNTPSLEAPTLKASNRASDGKIKLTWNEVSGAKEYKIYRSTSKSGSYKLIKTTTSTSFTNTSVDAGTKYYYKIKAIHNDSSYNSDYSEIVSCYCDLPRPEAKATSILSSGKIKISWGKVEGAKEYKVYRATSEKGEYELVKTTTSTSYTNTSAKAGTTYYYKVKAIHSNSSASSAYSTVVSKACKLAQPKVESSNVASSGKIKLTWEKVSGAKEYKIYRATSEDGDYELVKTTTSTSYTNTSAKAGKKYYYKVKAIHSDSTYSSAYSEVESRYCDLARPVVTIKLKSGDPRLTWEKVEGAKEYKIYRATSKNGEYKLVKTTTSTSFTNTSVKAGTTYYYKVKAIHSTSSASSAYSSVKSIAAK